MVKRIVDLHQPVAVTAAAFGVSERTAYKWLARFRAEGRDGLRDRSSRPKCSPRTIHPLRAARVLALRRRRLPGFQIARAARLSKSSVSRLLRRHRARLAALEPPPPVRRYERAHPGELLHFDIKKLARIVRPGHRVTGDRQHDHTRGAGWEFLHIALDDHSRLAFAQLLPDETAASAIAFLHAALAFFQKLGIKAQRLYSDNGSCYRAHAMRAASAALGLKQRFTRAYTPKLRRTADTPTARPNASSKPPSANGPTLTPTLTPTNAPHASHLSSTTTTGIALTLPSNSKPPSPASTCP